jgi:hypothetical protein
MTAVRDAVAAVFFVAHTRNHLNIFRPVAEWLAAQGRQTCLIDLYLAAAAPHPFGAVLGWQEFTRKVQPGDTVVVASDWGPPALVSFLDDCRRRGVIRVGIVEGCLWNLAGRYKHVDHLLAWGESALTESRCASVRVVGSPIVEQALQERPRFEEPPFVLINYKFVHRWNQGGQAWHDAVVGACRTLGIAWRVSRHPADNQVVDDVVFETRSLTELLGGTSAVVTRPSSVVFEAMAARKPVVIFPVLGEPLGEFAKPMQAFQIIHAPEKLAAALERALRDKLSYAARCRAFFEHHVSYDPDRPAARRIADALLELAGAPAPA